MITTFYKITVEPEPGAFRPYFTRDLCEISRQCQCIATSMFNDEEITAVNGELKKK